MKKFFIILIHGLIIWALCGASVVIGRSLVSMETTLIIHLILAPVFAGIVSLIYFKKFNYTSPLQTALIFLSIIIIFDAGLVAPVFEKSYEMFFSPLGTWIPFILIFTATFLTGTFIKKGGEK